MDSGLLQTSFDNKPLLVFWLKVMVAYQNNTSTKTFLYQQFHLLLAAFPLSPFQLLLLAQNDLRRPAALLPAFSLEGGVVTAVLRFPPVLLLYFFTPADVIPAPDSVLLLSPDFWDIPDISSLIGLGLSIEKDEILS